MPVQWAPRISEETWARLGGWITEAKHERPARAHLEWDPETGKLLSLAAVMGLTASAAGVVTFVVIDRASHNAPVTNVRPHMGIIDDLLIPKIWEFSDHPIWHQRAAKYDRWLLPAINLGLAPARKVWTTPAVVAMREQLSNRTTPVAKRNVVRFRKQMDGAAGQGLRAGVKSAGLIAGFYFAISFTPWALTFPFQITHFLAAVSFMVGSAAMKPRILHAAHLWGIWKGERTERRLAENRDHANRFARWLDRIGEWIRGKLEQPMDLPAHPSGKRMGPFSDLRKLSAPGAEVKAESLLPVSIRALDTELRDLLREVELEFRSSLWESIWDNTLHAFDASDEGGLLAAAKAVRALDNGLREKGLPGIPRTYVERLNGDLLNAFDAVVIAETLPSLPREAPLIVPTTRFQRVMRVGVKLALGATTATALAMTINAAPAQAGLEHQPAQPPAAAAPSVAPNPGAEPDRSEERAQQIRDRIAQQRSEAEAKVKAAVDAVHSQVITKDTPDEQSKAFLATVVEGIEAARKLGDGETAYALGNQFNHFGDKTGVVADGLTDRVRDNATDFLRSKSGASQQLGLTLDLAKGVVTVNR